MTFFRKLRWLKRRPAKEAELQEELQFHLEEEAADRQATGLSSEASRRAARRDLGNVVLVREDTRAAWSWNFWEQLGQDARYGDLKGARQEVRTSVPFHGHQILKK
jgi:hypothetical protein